MAISPNRKAIEPRWKKAVLDGEVGNWLSRAVHKQPDEVTYILLSWNPLSKRFLQTFKAKVLSKKVSSGASLYFHIGQHGLGTRKAFQITFKRVLFSINKGQEPRKFHMPLTSYVVVMGRGL